MVVKTWPAPGDFSILFHPFAAARLKGARCIWLHRVPHASPDQDNAAMRARREFLDAFAYLVPDGETFDRLEFDESDTLSMSAERYGGFGIGLNGGGARCGTIGTFQVKGCGKNLLAGPGQEVHHAYGGFKASYAVHEAIYATLLENILPGGAVRILGVILTGPDAAYIRSNIERGWGALMVREQALRPASFLRARAFRPAPETRRVLPSDVGRVRRVNRELYLLLGGQDGFEAYVRRFLRNCASQLTCARLLRLSHGALTASNLAIDGQWLDLTNTSFTCSTMNLGGGNKATPSFREELFAPIQIAIELIETFCKYTGADLATDWVEGFYRSRVRISMSHHIPFLFGQPGRTGQGVAPRLLPHLTRKLRQLISAAPTVYGRWPEALPADDPVVMFIESLLLAVGGCEHAVAFDDGEENALAEELRQVLRACWEERPAQQDWRSYLRGSYVRSMRQACMVEYFFKHRLEAAIDARLKAGNIDGLEVFMTNSIELGHWIFQPPELDELVIQGSSCTLRVLSGTARIDTTFDGETSALTAGELLASLPGVPDAFLAIEGFDCRPYVVRVLKGLHLLDLAAPFAG